MAGRTPVILVHGYSDKGASFVPWKKALVAAGYKESEVHVCEYRSLTNEVTIKDVAEGFDRALRTKGISPDTEFDAIVHSTGMLVIRSWLTTYARRRRQLKRLVALAPATNGSPLAHKGRGFLGAIFKGNKIPSPDFLEAGDLILDGLELGSRFTWDLAHQDLFSEQPFYRRGADSPYVFIMCGTDAYGGLRRLIHEEGTDGTVRWAGCSLDCQKLSLDLSRDPSMSKTAEERIKASDVTAEKALAMPFHPIAGKNHTTIISEPDGDLLDLVLRALGVESDDGFHAWLDLAAKRTAMARKSLTAYQQFVVRAVDERDDPVTDYYVELFTREGEAKRRIPFDLDVHPYRADPSLRCFHVNLTELLASFPDGKVPPLWIRLIASSGSDLVGYHGLNSERLSRDLTKMNDEGVWDAELNLPEVFGERGIRLFYPFTTTFVELRLNRDPMPFGLLQNKVCYFV